MEIPKNLKDSILQGVLGKVMDNITPGDDTPDDDDGILGMVKRAIPPYEDKESGVMGLMMNALSGSSGGGIMDMLGDLLGGGRQEQPAAREESSTGGMLDMLGDLLGGSKGEQTSEPDSGGGLADILGGLFGGSQQEEAPAQSSGGGILDALGGLFGGGQSQSQTASRDSGLLGTITDAIGGEGVIGDILESVLKSKGISASNLAENPALMDSIKDIVVDLIKDFVVNKIKASLTGGDSQGVTVSKILDMLTPDS